jgi:hypothetical protein
MSGETAQIDALAFLAGLSREDLDAQIAARQGELDALSILRKAVAVRDGELPVKARRGKAQAADAGSPGRAHGDGKPPPRGLSNGEQQIATYLAHHGPASVDAIAGDLRMSGGDVLAELVARPGRFQRITQGRGIPAKFGLRKEDDDS